MVITMDTTKLEIILFIKFITAKYFNAPIILVECKGSIPYL